MKFSCLSAIYNGILLNKEAIKQIKKAEWYIIERERAWLESDPRFLM